MSPRMVPLLPSSDSRHSVPSLLLHQPKRWTSEHLQTLKLSQQWNLSAEAIVGAQCLPSDGDEEFETLAAEFTKPTSHDLADFGTKRSIYRRNIFHLVFLRLNEAAKSKDYSESSKQAMFILFEVLLSNVEAAEKLHITFGSEIPFQIRSCGVQGALKCGGVLFRSSAINEVVSLSLPVATLLVVKDHDDTDTAHEVSQILLQGILAYDQSPTLDSHTAFVLRMDRTFLQLGMAAISRIYMEELCRGKPLSENLGLFHSELYDLRECDRRKEALRLIIGLFRLLDTEKRD